MKTPKQKNSAPRKSANLEDIYKNRDPYDLPWNMASLPAPLAALVDSNMVKPCKTIDIGCGIGSYAIHLAERGFDVLGIDAAPSALLTAKQTAAEEGVSCRFKTADALSDPRSLGETFDFAYDWHLLHHIYPEQRKRYAENVQALLNPGGKYLSVCFSEKDMQFGGRGKYRKTRLGTTLYFSNEQEQRKLFKPLFTILELKTIETPGRTAPHQSVYVFMERA